MCLDRRMRTLHTPYNMHGKLSFFYVRKIRPDLCCLWTAYRVSGFLEAPKTFRKNNVYFFY